MPSRQSNCAGRCAQSANRNNRQDTTGARRSRPNKRGGEMIIKEHRFADVPTPTGTMRLHIVEPAAPGRYPGLLLYSEIYQITAPVRRMAAYLAGHGFVVAAPEVYHEFETAGTVLGYDKPGTDRGNDLKFTKETAKHDSDARAGLDFLAAHPNCTGRRGAI